MTEALLVLEHDTAAIRIAAGAARIPCVTTLSGAFAAVQGIDALLRNGEEPRSLPEYHARLGGRPPGEERDGA